MHCELSMQETKQSSTTASTAMVEDLDVSILLFKRWREHLAEQIQLYRQWLMITHSGDQLKENHLTQLAESLFQDKLILAFVAEFSRGKTELINALFFSDYGERLLPSNPGRTTMCPTEIFWDPFTPPSIQLLPIETRKTETTLLSYKNDKTVWSTIQLNTASLEDMKTAFEAIVAQKAVSVDEARTLGLWRDDDPDAKLLLTPEGMVEVPVWRHAMINFPHPLLKNGLVILDTPGLNTIGSEPELTLGIIPNAHAVIFILATDTGVTRSDMHIWNHYIQPRASRKIAVLNKIDILWDELKSEGEIQASIAKQVQLTARTLGLPPEHVLALSAQKALLANIRRDKALRTKSGIAHLVGVIKNDVIGTKHAILRNTVVKDTCEMMKVSRKVFQQRLNHVKTELQELETLSIKTNQHVRTLLKEVSEEKQRYEASLKTFKTASDAISKIGQDMLSLLDNTHLETMTDNSKKIIDNSWTTKGLNRGIKQLVADSNTLAQHVNALAKQIQIEAHELYNHFHEVHGFEPLNPEPLDLGHFINSMQEIGQITEQFCADPINIMTEKHFVVKKFYKSLGVQVAFIYEEARKTIRVWLQEIVTPLLLQINAHKSHLDQRNEALMQYYKDDKQHRFLLAKKRDQFVHLHNHCAQLDKLMVNVMRNTFTLPHELEPEKNDNSTSAP